MGLIYVDACLLIYLVEEHPVWVQPVRQALAQPAASLHLALSALVKAECLVKPFRLADHQLEQDYLSIFGRFQSLDIIEDDFLAAARLRARFGLKLPDALHLACAQRHACTQLWTNDDRLYEASGGMAVKI